MQMSVPHTQRKRNTHALSMEKTTNGAAKKQEDKYTHTHIQTYPFNIVSYKSDEIISQTRESNRKRVKESQRVRE